MEGGNGEGREDKRKRWVGICKWEVEEKEVKEEEEKKRRKR